MDDNKVTSNKYVEDVPAYIQAVYRNNNFMAKFFDVCIDEIHCGGATVSLDIDPEKHMNHRGVVHGGVLTALADAVLGVTCASVGEKVATLNSNMNFIRNVNKPCKILVKSTIKHHGHTTMVVYAEMFNENDELMATVLNTMFVVDHFEEIPRKW